MSQLEEMRTAFTHTPCADSHLPYVMRHGHSVTEMAYTCPKCDRPVMGDFLHGEFVQQTSEVAAFYGHGICKSCRLIFPANVRVRAEKNGDMRIEYQHNGGWLYRNMISTDFWPQCKDKIRATLQRWFSQKG